jgi:hypothetical protein
MQKTSSASKLNAQLKFGAYLSGRPAAIGPCTLPKLQRHPQRLDIELLPCEFISRTRSNPLDKGG